MDSNPICHPSPTKKMKCLFLYYVQLLMISWAGRWTRTPSATPLKPKKWNPHFCITFNFWWLAGLVIGLKPHRPPLSSQKKWNAYFWITFNFWWSARLVDGLKPHPPPLCGHKVKCLFLHYVQLVMIGRAGQWTRTPSAAPLQQKKWNAHFWITFNFWWSARLVKGFQPHLQPLSNQKSEMLIFVLCSNSGDLLSWSIDSNPICNPSPTKKMKCLFLYYIILLMIGQAGQWTQTPSTTPLQPKYEMLIFGLRSTSDDRSGWSMDSNPICHPSPTKKMICSFLEHAQLLMICQAGQWTQTPSASPLQPKKWNAHFWIMFNFWWSAGLVEGLQPHLQPLSNQKNEMLIFGLCSTSDDQPGWSKDSNPICHPSPTKKMKCLFLYYVIVQIISRAGRWTQSPSTTPQAKKMKC